MKISDKIVNEMPNSLFFFLNILCWQRCKLDVSKCVVTAMRFAVDDKRLVKWMWVKKYVEKPLLKMFLSEGEVLIG